MPFILTPPGGGSGGAALPFEPDPGIPPRLYDPSVQVPFGIYDYESGAFTRRHPRPSGFPGNYLLVTSAFTVNNLNAMRGFMAGEGMTLTERSTMLWDEAYLSQFDGVVACDQGSGLPPGGWSYRFPLFHLTGSSLNTTLHNAFFNSATGNGTTLISNWGDGVAPTWVVRPGSPLDAVIPQNVATAVAVANANMRYVSSNATMTAAQGQVWAGVSTSNTAWHALSLHAPLAYAAWLMAPNVDFTTNGLLMQEMILGAWLNTINPA